MRYFGKYVMPVMSVLGITFVFGMTTLAQAKDVSGKVVAVFHEPVTINTKVFDKVSATVLSCQTGQFETVSYGPGNVSDDNSLGYLFNHLANAARSTSQKNQYMNTVSGHAMFVVNEQNVVQKTTFWGYNWECGKDLDRGGAASSGGASAAPASAPGASPQAAPANPVNKLRRFGL